jgi:hypothetical protein
MHVDSRQSFLSNSACAQSDGLTNVPELIFFDAATGIPTVHVCMYVCMYVRKYASMCEYLCMCVRVYKCANIHINIMYMSILHTFSTTKIRNSPYNFSHVLYIQICTPIYKTKSSCAHTKITYIHVYIHTSQNLLPVYILESFPQILGQICGILEMFLHSCAELLNQPLLHLYVCMYVCMIILLVYIHMYTWLFPSSSSACFLVVCMYACMCVCSYYACVYVHITHACMRLYT